MERVLDLPRVELLETTTSTLDVAHRLASQGAPSGTLVIANEQTAGRGRLGRSWHAPPGQFPSTAIPGVVAAATVFRSILFGKTHGLALSSERRRVQSMREQFNTGSMESKEKQP